jgi:hypothetical protein
MWAGAAGVPLLFSQLPSAPQAGAPPAAAAPARSRVEPPERIGDVILRAMRAELDRSRGLKLMGVDTPYFTEYSVDDTRSFSASASMGALIGARWSRMRAPRAQVRVGSPEFDNTNSIFSELPGGSRFDAEQLPLDNDELAIRQQLWLATDRAYKNAVQAISRKRAALRNLAQPEQLADFAAAKPAQLALNPGTFTFDEKLWTNRVRAMSSLFRTYSEVLSSGVDFEAVQSTAYYMNTEGSYYRIPDTLTFLRATATAQASDGMTFHDAVVFQSLTTEGLPPEPEMRNTIQKMASELVALIKAPRGERYSGPMLFEPQAAAQVFAAVLGRNFALPRKPVTQPNFPLPFLSSELEGRAGSRVLPEWMDVVDDPTQKEWRGRTLFGHYPVDLEGVPPEPLTLIEKGVLKNFLLTRQPVRGYAASNGRARLPGNFGARSATVSNLFIKAAQTVPPATLRRNLLDMVQKRGLPFGIVVRKIDYPSSASMDEVRRIAAAIQSSGSTRPITAPILVYRVYPDGREELIRGVRFRGLNSRSFRDIVGASDENYAFDYLENNALFAMSGAAGYVAPVTVVAPAVLFEDLELERVEDDLQKPPIVPPPSISQLR